MLFYPGKEKKENQKKCVFCASPFSINAVWRWSSSLTNLSRTNFMCILLTKLIIKTDSNHLLISTLLRPNSSNLMTSIKVKNVPRVDKEWMQCEQCWDYYCSLPGTACYVKSASTLLLILKKLIAIATRKFHIHQLCTNVHLQNLKMKVCNVCTISDWIKKT